MNGGQCTSLLYGIDIYKILQQTLHPTAIMGEQT